MRKKIFKIIFVICLLLPISFIFSACGPKVVDLTLTGEMEIYIGSFSIEDYSLTVVLSDETTKQFALSEEYVSAEDLAKLSTVGTHTITVNYSGYSEEFTIVVKKYTFNDLVFNSATYTYDGTAKTIEVENLPDGASVDYSILNTQTNVGTYNITATVTLENYETATLDATLTINKADYDMSGVTFTGKTETYDGSVKTIAITGELPEGLSVRYMCGGSTFTGKTDAGTYTVVAIFTNSNSNYNGVGNKSATLTIEKADFNMSSISFVDNTITYDGLKKSITISGEMPSWITVKYYYNNTLSSGVINAGEYQVEARFSHSNKNYNAIPSKYATLIIEKANFDSSTLTFADKTVSYNEDEVHGIFVEGDIPNGVSVSYYCEGERFYFTSYVGTYVVTAKFSSSNYNAIQELTATLTINKAVYNMSGISMTDKTVEYDGELKSLEIAGTLPSGVSVMYYYNDVRGNGVSEHGEYAVVAKFVGDYTNYEQIPSISAILTIIRETHTITFKQEGQPDIIKHVLNLADFTDIPEPNNDASEKGYGYVWEEANYTSVTTSFVVNAKYQKMIYTITYDYGTATIPEGSPTTYMVDTETIVLQMPKLSGHTLLGLYANDNFKEKITEIPKGSTGDIKITAWFDVATPGLVIGGGTVISYNGTAKNVYIPATHNGSTVTEIYDNAFKGKDIQIIMLPETITWIGANAFENCTSLYKIHIPSAVDTIEWFAFQGCSSLEIATFGEGIDFNYSSEIPQGMFSGCSSLKEIIIPKSITRISDKAFYNCYSLEKLTFEEGSKINLIGSYNFNDCLVTEVILPANDVWIGLDVFKNCQNLATFSIGGDCGIDAVCDGAFANCIALTSITISKDLNMALFSATAFEGCVNLKTVYNYCNRLKLTPGGTNYEIERYAENIYTTK